MQIGFIDSLQQVAANQWNVLCPADYPFVRYEFLAALEDTLCTTALTGWQPQHLVVYDGGKLVAAMPAYIKTHSYGEYVFDWAWADAYRRYGYDYYPKLVCAIPFTPCVGARLLCADSATYAQVLPRIVPTLMAHCDAQALSGWHCLFPSPVESAQLLQQGAIQRLGCQFHWFNRDYRDFDELLAAMNSRKRKNINKERRLVQEQGIVFATKQGAAITTADWDIFYALYRNTYTKRSGHNGYLTRDFFQRIGSCLADHVVLVTAAKPAANASPDTIAAALYFRDATTLYGRYWGCFEEYQFLHFETCYYQGIEYAITHNLQRFDGGAQGEHKISRGFEPVLTYSNHWLANEQFRPAIAHFVAQETQNIKHYAAEARSLLPYK